ncbi:MAG: helix-turn-helix domain-containing protein [Oscillospiraceae bacterium]
MAVTLSSQEVAALTGKTERTVRRWAESGKIPAERVLNKFNSPGVPFQPGRSGTPPAAEVF